MVKFCVLAQFHAKFHLAQRALLFRGSRFQVRGETMCHVFLTVLQILGPNDTGFEVREPLWQEHLLYHQKVMKKH